MEVSKVSRNKSFSEWNVLTSGDLPWALGGQSQGAGIWESALDNVVGMNMKNSMKGLKRVGTPYEHITRTLEQLSYTFGT